MAPQEIVDQRLPGPGAHNGYRHDTTGQVVIMANADNSAYEKFCHDFCADLAPEGAVEIAMAQAIADDRWRIQRAAALENSIFVLGFDPDRELNPHPEMNISLQQAATWMRQNKNLNALSMYESRTLRRIQTNTALLEARQAQRRAALEKVVEETRVLAQLAASKGEAFDLQATLDAAPECGFIFSVAAIDRLVGYKNRLTAAVRASKLRLTRAA